MNNPNKISKKSKKSNADSAQLSDPIWDSIDSCDDNFSKSMDKDNRREVDCFSTDEGIIQVGEELFQEICEAWLDTHGIEIVEKCLQSRKKVSAKPSTKLFGR